MRQKAALLILGLLLGAILMNAITGNRLESLYREKENLQLALFEATERLKRLERQHSAPQVLTVQEVNLEFTIPDRGVELPLRQQLGEITQDLIGEDLSALNPVIAAKLLDGRTFNIEGRRYTVAVRLLVISETITYYLEVTAPEDD